VNELPIALEGAGSAPLHRQLYDQLRDAIVSGRLARGVRLPSSRALAESLGVSRSTVISTFGQLLSEGYLKASTGSGTYVSDQLPEESVPRVRRERTAMASAFRLSTYGVSLVHAPSLEPPRVPGTIDFRDGRPALERFPFDVWRRLIGRYLRADARRFDYSASAAGYEPLRAAVADYLSRARAVRCTADDVVIVIGSQQAIDLTTRVLVEPGEAVAVEDPGYLGAQRTFAAHGAEVYGVPVDEHGMNVDALARIRDTMRLVYVTPSHQFPMGVVLSLERRMQLLRWAERAGAVIFEDDYDSAYRYEGRPIPALQGLDAAGRVVYCGTFSKTLFPALRIGYVVVPRPLREVFIEAKAFSDRQSPILEQCALADFIAEGHYERHLRRMRVLYRSRREALLRALRTHVGGALEVVGDSAGMHLLVRLPVADEASLVERARAAGVVLLSTSVQYLRERPRGEFIFGFAENDEATIDEGVRRLARVLRDHSESGSSALAHATR
jgi:GntR family transcriptional regulator/MocR family aminotransferase